MRLLPRRSGATLARGALDDVRRRLLDLAASTRASAAELEHARARVEREIGRIARTAGRSGAERQRAAAAEVAALRAHESALVEQQRRTEAHAARLAREAAELAREPVAASAAERAGQRVADVRRIVRDAEDATIRLVARARALDELRLTEHYAVPPPGRALPEPGQFTARA